MRYDVDTELEASTNKVMMIGTVLLFAMALVFPLYRWVEPTTREESREANLASLSDKGQSLWGLNCSSCHGLNGEGGVGPTLNSQQFLQSATDQQTEQIIAVGVPGSQMSAYSQDYFGPLTSEQIKALAIYIRSWEEDAPDVPDWRAGQPGG
jgi:mono/diheme cytochrome c family protein